MKKIHQVRKNASARSAAFHIFSNRVSGVIEHLSSFSTLSEVHLRIIDAYNDSGEIISVET